MSDQDRISHYNIDTVKSTQVTKGLLVDPIPNSPN